MVGIQIKIPVWIDRIFAWPVMMYRKWKYGYKFRRIYIGEGLYTIVDPDIYYRLGHLRWSVCGDGRKDYAARIDRKFRYGRTKTIFLHREIMNAPKGILVDHSNGESLDNRRDNLRLATHSQNMQNRRKRKNTTSRYAGVYFEKRRKKWTANININKKKIWLGRFDDEIEAAKAYDEAARKYHGEFARLNFTEENKKSKCKYKNCGRGEILLTPA
jgi:hypothetical protein